MDTTKFKEAIDTGDYKAQGEEFLKMTDTTMDVEFLRHGKHFDNDTDTRDIYRITLHRGGRDYAFDFGMATFSSCLYISNVSADIYRAGKGFHDLQHFKSKTLGFGLKTYKKNKDFNPPTVYDVLASLTKYDPGTFKDFCGDFGYDTDSRSAEKTYKAVVDEYKNLTMLFNDEELELMAEIN